MLKPLAARAVCTALVTSFIAGCAGVPPLREAEIAEVSLATSEDLSRFKMAKDTYYPRDLPQFTLLEPAWPIVRIAFRSSQQLFNPLEAGMRHAVVYSCGDRDRDWDSGGLGSVPILWRDKVVDKAQSEQIAGQLATAPGPQEYEVFIKYDNWDDSEVRAPGDPITLIPLQEDLCLSLQKLNYPFAPGIGEPLRISKNQINRAVGELPISLPVPELPIRPAPPS